MLRKFASIEHAETIGYAYDTDGYTSNAAVHSAFRAFQTYGDGMCQHSGDWSIQPEHVADYLFSLAAAMLEDTELTQYLYFKLAARPADEAIAFAASVVFKPAAEGSRYEKKARFYSVEERKLTATDSKRHDRRYEQVADWNDGTPSAIMRMICPQYADGLERLQYATAIRDWLLKQDGGYMELAARFIGWTKDIKPEYNQNDAARDIMHALECVQNVCNAYTQRCAAESSLGSQRRDVARRKEQDAPAPVEAEAPAA